MVNQIAQPNIGCICATREFCNREKNCLDFPLQPTHLSYGTTLFHAEKEKNKLIILDGEDLDWLQEREECQIPHITKSSRPTYAPMTQSYS